jgi:hypothetical protein
MPHVAPTCAHTHTHATVAPRGSHHLTFFHLNKQAEGMNFGPQPQPQSLHSAGASRMPPTAHTTQVVLLTAPCTLGFLVKHPAVGFLGSSAPHSWPTRHARPAADMQWVLFVAVKRRAWGKASHQGKHTCFWQCMQGHAPCACHKARKKPGHPHRGDAAMLSSRMQPPSSQTCLAVSTHPMVCRRHTKRSP